MRREVCGSGFHHAVAEGREIQALEHRLASSEQDRRKRKVQFIGSIRQVLARPRDPYTRGLIGSIPKLRQRGVLGGIPGDRGFWPGWSGRSSRTDCSVR